MNQSRPRQPKPQEARISKWLSHLNDSEHALWLLFALSFLETIIIPIPIELVLIPFMVTNRHRLWRTAGYVTAGCLAASVFGYGVGYFLFETIGTWALDTFGWQQGYVTFQVLFDRHGFFAILAIGVIPVPFQAAMLTAGVAGYPVWKFVLAATIARGIRYYGLAALVAIFAEKAHSIWKRHKVAASLILMAIVVCVWLLSRWIAAADLIDWT
ncbi:MAG: YqaA family protein [Desulfovibrionales bacterium]